MDDKAKVPAGDPGVPEITLTLKSVSPEASDHD